MNAATPPEFVPSRRLPDPCIEVLDEPRGFATTRADFATFANGRKRLLMEDFYRWQRARHEVLLDDGEPTGGQWNLDHANRKVWKGAPPEPADVVVVSPPPPPPLVEPAAGALPPPV